MASDSSRAIKSSRAGMRCLRRLSLMALGSRGGVFPERRSLNTSRYRFADASSGSRLRLSSIPPVRAAIVCTVRPSLASAACARSRSSGSFAKRYALPIATILSAAPSACETWVMSLARETTASSLRSWKCLADSKQTTTTATVNALRKTRATAARFRGGRVGDIRRDQS